MEVSCTCCGWGVIFGRAPAPRDIDLANIPPEIVRGFPRFTLDGMALPARVARVIDGDTLELLFAINYGEGRSAVQIPLKFNCRLAGVDAAEKNTSAGKAALALMTQQYAAHRNMVWAVCGKPDKYGRQLVTLYDTEKQGVCFNTLLLKYRDPQLGAIAVPYDGGNKATAWAVS